MNRIKNMSCHGYKVGKFRPIFFFSNTVERFPVILNVCVCVCGCGCVLSRFSCVQLFATPWTVAHKITPSMGFSKQEYWSGLPFPTPGELLDPRI